MIQKCKKAFPRNKVFFLNFMYRIQHYSQHKCMNSPLLNYILYPNNLLDYSTIRKCWPLFYCKVGNQHLLGNREAVKCTRLELIQTKTKRYMHFSQFAKYPNRRSNSSQIHTTTKWITPINFHKPNLIRSFHSIPHLTT